MSPWKVATIVVLALGPLMAPLTSDAQKSTKVYRIGVLSPFSPPAGPSPPLEAFRQGLRDLGWIEGQNIAMEYRWAEGKTERLPKLAAELVRLNVEVIFVAWGTAGALAAKQATSTIPIVMGAVGDPVGAGLAAGLARPGGNITGLSSLALELEGKRLELLKEVVPKLSRVAVLWDPANPYSSVAYKEKQAAARTLGVKLQSVVVREATDFDPAFAAMTRDRPGGLVVHGYIVLVRHRTRIVEFAAKNRLPAIYPLTDFVDAGGLMSYGASVPDNHRRAAAYVDKILKGTKPADLPVEQPTRFELVVNLKTAKALGLTIPPSVLVRADKVIQ